MTVNSPSSYASLAKKYKFDYVVHGDDWKTGPQAESRKKLKITMKEWNGRVIDIPYTKDIFNNYKKKSKMSEELKSEKDFKNLIKEKNIKKIFVLSGEKFIY